MTDEKALLGTAMTAREPTTGTREAQEMAAVDRAPANPRNEGPSNRRRQFTSVRIVILVVAAAAAGWLYVGQVTNNLATEPPATHVAQIKPVPQQRNVGGQLTADNGDRGGQALSADYAQLQQGLEQERNKGTHSAVEVSAKLVQLQRDLGQARDQGEQLTRKLAAEMAQFRQERSRAEKVTDELTAKVAGVDQSLQQERGKTKQLNELPAEVVQLKQALEQQRTKGEQQVGDLATQLAEA